MRDKTPSPEHQNERPSPRGFLARALLFLERQVLEFARDSHRDPNEFKKPLVYRYGLEIGVLLLLAAFFATTVGPTLVFQVTRWGSHTPDIRIDSSRWQVAFDVGEGCGRALEPSCVGHPENPTLWRSPVKITDSGYYREVQRYQGKRFWIGLELSPEEVKSAIRGQFSVLAFGIFNSSFKIFVNGKLAESGNGRDFFPISVQLPLDLLGDQGPVRISVEIDHNLGSRLPVWFKDGMSGLFSFDRARAYISYWISFLSFYLLILFSWAVLIAAVFFALWASVPRKVEYFFFALYLAVFSFLLFMKWGPIAYGTFRPTFYFAEYWLVAVEGAAGCLLGVAFSRARRIYFFWVMAVCAIATIGSYVSANDHIDLYAHKDVLMKFYVPFMFVLGALFCFSQALLLKREPPRLINEQSRYTRTRRLIGVGFLLVVFSGIYYAENRIILSAPAMHLEITMQLAFLILIGVYLFADYRDREKQFEIVLRSPFHDPFGGKANQVFGFLVSFDLKKSSLLANFAAEHQIEIKPTTLWNTLVGQVTARYQGFKIADEGDGLKTIFPCALSLNDLTHVVLSVLEAYAETKALEHRLKSSGMMPAEAKLEFRAGIVWGGLNPIWKDFVGVRTAEWEDAKGTTALKDVQRIMDVEKELGEIVGGGSVIAIRTDLDIEHALPHVQITRIRQNVRDIGETQLVLIKLSESLKIKNAG